MLLGRSLVDSCSTAPTTRASPDASSSTTCWCSPAVSSRPRGRHPALLHARYQRIMLDEFQDTDPIQLEIAVRLASRRRPGPRHRLAEAASRAGAAVHRRRPEAVDLPVPSRRHRPVPACRRAGRAPIRSADRQLPLHAAVIDCVNDVFGRVIPDQTRCPAAFRCPRRVPSRRSARPRHRPRPRRGGVRQRDTWTRRPAADVQRYCARSVAAAMGGSRCVASASRPATSSPPSRLRSPTGGRDDEQLDDAPIHACRATSAVLLPARISLPARSRLPCASHRASLPGRELLGRLHDRRRSDH